MKSFVWFLAGIFIGFAAAHQANKTPRGQAFFANVNSSIRDFGDAVADGYRRREAELLHPDESR